MTAIESLKYKSINSFKIKQEHCGYFMKRTKPKRSNSNKLKKKRDESHINEPIRWYDMNWLHAVIVDKL